MISSTTMKNGPTEVYTNVSNFRASLTSSPTSPRYMVQATEAAPAVVNGASGRSGGSSKVIERLTAENDRLRRELRAERAAKEEAEESLRVQKNLIASMQSTQSNLEHVHGSDKLLAERKDRRIAQLKESLEVEVSRRTFAEDKSREMGDKLGETAAAAQKDIAEAQIAAKRAEVAYDALRSTYDQLHGEVLALRQRIKEVEASNKGLDKNIHRIAILGEERDKHQASAQRTNAQLRKRLDEYQAQEMRMTALETEMEDAIRAMRWVVKLHGPVDPKAH
jgi:chromosome segregation ATPase